MAAEDIIREQAIAWAVRSSDPTFADWDALTDWLESSPAHARAYDEATAAAFDAAEVMAFSAPANDTAPASDVGSGDDAVLVDGPHARSPLLRRPWFGAAIAASLVAVVAVWLVPASSDPYRLDTAPGMLRTVELEHGTRVDLAGGTSIELDRKNPRFARLIEGEALFTVRHDPDRPFKVAVGDEQLVDLGTVFDVRHTDGALRVGVSEGTVEYDPDGAQVRIEPGEVLRRAKGSHEVTLAPQPAAQVGEWREGRLTFAGAPLADVAADLRRATGIDYVVAPGAAQTPISGSVLLAPLRQDPASLGPLLGIGVEREGDGTRQRWVIGAP